MSDPSPTPKSLPSPPPSPTRPIHACTRADLEAFLKETREPAFRLDQILSWLHVRRAGHWDEMSNLPKSLRTRLAQTFRFSLPELVRRQGSSDSTQKFLWRLHDGALIESVLIPANPALYSDRSDRHTLCVSTQVGCAYGCRFCASGLDGFQRNLTPDEIVGQVLATERWHRTQIPAPDSPRLQPPSPEPTISSSLSRRSEAQVGEGGSAHAEPGEGSPPRFMVSMRGSRTVPPSPEPTPSTPPPIAGDPNAFATTPSPGNPSSRPPTPPRLIDNLVIMGMGEPFANYDHLLRALRILNAPWGGGIGARKITVSTSGLAPQIRRFGDEPEQFRLAISLHGATDAVRARIMPINRRYPLADLSAACAHYLEKKGRMITFEYILLSGINDALTEVKPLASLARRLHAKVNLIPYNAVEGLPWTRPDDAHCTAFANALERLDVSTTLRLEKGHDIDAACGQLRLKTERTENPPMSGCLL